MLDDKRAESFVLSFRDGIVLLEQPDGGTVLQASDAEITLGRPSSGFRTALRVLSSDGATEAQLLDLVSHEGGGEGEMSKVSDYLRYFIQHGMLCHTITWNETRLAALVPLVAAWQEIPNEPAPEARFELSRFIYLRKDAGQFVLESPLADAKIVLYDSRVITLLNTLVKPCSLEDLYRAHEDIPCVSIALFVRLLLRCQALSQAGEQGHLEGETSALAQWEFHDLLFHTRSRLGRHANPYGATFRFQDKIAPLPAVKAPPVSDEVVRLYAPDIQTLCENDIPFTRVLEQRHSIRKHGEQPITAQQLGEFLYRTARLRVLSEVTEEGYERSGRPYPNGGGCHELEFYVAVSVCEGLSPGLFHYCPKTHQLYRLAGWTRELNELLEGAYYAADQQSMPGILIILSARFQRVAWKYEAIAYALILKHVGVVYQTMYLVATAMGLAPCALGGGNSDIFAASAGTNYYAETSVGEFILGSKAT
jgi:SagB-type dehydrogenase family enzyme